jgi:hypothetical protein
VRPGGAYGHPISTFSPRKKGEVNVIGSPRPQINEPIVLVLNVERGEWRDKGERNVIGSARQRMNVRASKIGSLLLDLGGSLRMDPSLNGAGRSRSPAVGGASSTSVHLASGSDPG